MNVVVCFCYEDTVRVLPAVGQNPANPYNCCGADHGGQEEEAVFNEGILPAGVDAIGWVDVCVDVWGGHPPRSFDFSPVHFETTCDEMILLRPRQFALAR